MALAVSLGVTSASMFAVCSLVGLSLSISIACACMPSIVCAGYMFLFDYFVMSLATWAVPGLLLGFQARVSGMLEFSDVRTRFGSRIPGLIVNASRIAAHASIGMGGASIVPSNASAGDAVALVTVHIEASGVVVNLPVAHQANLLATSSDSVQSVRSRALGARVACRRLLNCIIDASPWTRWLAR